LPNTRLAGVSLISNTRQAGVWGLPNTRRAGVGARSCSVWRRCFGFSGRIRHLRSLKVILIVGGTIRMRPRLSRGGFDETDRHYFAAVMPRPKLGQTLTILSSTTV